MTQKACRDDHSAPYLRAAALQRDLALARAENERSEVWEICEDRCQTRSTVPTSQLSVSRWHERIGDPTIAYGIRDRLVRNAENVIESEVLQHKNEHVSD